MNDTVVIVTGAAPLDPRAVAAIPSNAIVIAADGGLDHARAAGLTPAGLIGDLDSVSETGLAWAEQHATIQRHPVDKDATDTELAVAFAAGMDPSRVVMVAGGGDRLDHTLAAIGALGAVVLTSVPLVECWWGGQYLQVVHGPGRASIRATTTAGRPAGTSGGAGGAGGAGTRISLLAMHGPCSGVTMSGTRWPLDQADLGPLVGHGLSNVAIDHDVEIAVSTGVLTVFVDPPPVSTSRS